MRIERQLSTRFRLPPLTLQPIVGNAVKHGVDPELEPLSITVQTRAAEDGAELIAANNGQPYEPADDDEPHIALNNIRERLFSWNLNSSISP